MYQNIPFRHNPTLLIILIDRSIFTSRPIGNSSIAEKITNDLNILLSELVLYRGTCIYPSIGIEIIGYGEKTNDCSILLSCNISELPNKILFVQHKKTRIPDGGNGYIDIDYDFPNYIVPKSVWIPNEDKAFSIAKDLVEKYSALRKNEDDCVPMVINFTTGNCPRESQKMLINISQDIRSIKMYDGAPLIINLPYLNELSCINNDKYNYLIKSSSIDTIKELLSNNRFTYVWNNINQNSQNPLYISNIKELISFVKEFYNYFDGDYVPHNSF